MDIDRLGGGISVLVREADSVIVCGAPDAGVSRHGKLKIASHLERCPLRKRGITGDVERQLDAQPVI